MGTFAAEMLLCLGVVLYDGILTLNFNEQQLSLRVGNYFGTLGFPVQDATSPSLALLVDHLSRT